MPRKVLAKKPAGRTVSFHLKPAEYRRFDKIKRELRRSARGVLIELIIEHEAQAQ